MHPAALIYLLPPLTLDAGDTNAPPTLTTGAGASVLYAPGAPAVTLWPAAAIADTDNDDLNHLRLAADGFVDDEALQLGATPVSFPHDTDATEDLTAGGLTFTATWTAASQTLEVTRAATTPAQWQTLLRTLGYANATAEPTHGPRVITATIDDPMHTSTVATITVTVALPGEVDARDALNLPTDPLDAAYLLYDDRDADIEADGKTLIDHSGNNKAATLSHSPCLDFDGTDDYVTLTSTGTSIHADDYTLSGSVVFDNVSSQQSIAFQIAGTGTARTFLHVTSATWQSFLNGSQRTWTGLTAPAINTQYDFVLTKTGTTWNLTVNGQAANPLTVTDAAATGNFYLGRTAGGNYLNGRLWDVRFEHSTNGFHVPLSEGRGTFATDVSGAARHGTITGATWTTQNAYHHATLYGAELYDDDATAALFLFVPHATTGTKITSPTIAGYAPLADYPPARLLPHSTTQINFIDGATWKAGDGDQVTPAWHAGEPDGAYNQFYVFDRIPADGLILDLAPAGFRTAAPAVPTDGQAIATWLDATAFAHHFTATTAPTYAAAADAANCDGINQSFARLANNHQLRFAPGRDFTALLVVDPTVAADTFPSIADDCGPVPIEINHGTYAPTTSPLGSALRDAGIYLSDDWTPNGDPDIGAYQHQTGLPWFGPRRLVNGHMIGLPPGFTAGDPADAATVTGISETGTPTLLFTRGAEWVAAWKVAATGATRWTNFNAALTSPRTIRDGLAITLDRTKGAVVLQDGHLVVHFNTAAEIAAAFMSSLRLPWAPPTQQTAFGVTTAGNLTGKVTSQTVILSVPLTSGDTNCVVEYRLAGATTWRRALDAAHLNPTATSSAHYPTDLTGIDHWFGAIANLAPGETYDVRMTTAGLGTLTTTATTWLPMALPTGTVLNATPATFDSLAATANAGDRILCAAGKYPGAKTFNRSGTQAAPIQIASADPTNPAIFEHLTIAANHVWLDALAFRYQGTSFGLTVTRSGGVTAAPTYTNVQYTRLDLDGKDGAGATAQAINAYAGWHHITDCYVAGNQTVLGSLAGEGIELGYEAQVSFNNIQDVGDGISYGSGNQHIANNEICRISDDFIECDKASEPKILTENLLHAGGNNGISLQEYYGSVYIFHNWLSGVRAGQMSFFKINGSDPGIRVFAACNTFWLKTSSQGTAELFGKPDLLWANNLAGCKSVTPAGDNKIGYGTLSYGADADWSPNVRLWDYNAYVTGNNVFKIYGNNTLAGLQAKNVETHSLQLENYGTTVPPTSTVTGTEDPIKTLLYVGATGERDPEKPTGAGLCLRMTREEGLTFLSRHTDQTPDAIANLPLPTAGDPFLIVLRYHWDDPTGKSIILHDGQAHHVAADCAQDSPLSPAGQTAAYIGARGFTDAFYKGHLKHLRIYAGNMPNADLNAIATALAADYGLTWTDL